MEIYYEFDFIEEEPETDIQIGDLVFFKEDIVSCLKAFQDVNKWSEASIYSSCFKEVHLLITDIPGDGVFAQIDGDEYLETIFIEMNILNLIYDYHHTKLCEVVFGKKVDLYTFVSFFLLHELGHIVHCYFVIPKGKTLYQKFEDYYYKYLSFYNSLDKKFGPPTDVFDIKSQKEYRTIPSEQVADSFAFQQLNLIMIYA